MLQWQSPSIIYFILNNKNFVLVLILSYKYLFVGYYINLEIYQIFFAWTIRTWRRDCIEDLIKFFRTIFLRFKHIRDTNWCTDVWNPLGTNWNDSFTKKITIISKISLRKEQKAYSKQILAVLRFLKPVRILR